MPDPTETRVRLDVDGPIATITNDNPEKHNAFDDAMDQRLFEILGELKERPDVRAIIWRGERKSWSSGRDVVESGGQVEIATDPSQLEEMLAVAGPIVAWTT